MSHMRRQANQGMLRILMLLFLAGLLVRPVWAGSGIHCFVDKKTGVTNCTNIGVRNASKPDISHVSTPSQVKTALPVSAAVAQPVPAVLSAMATPLGDSRPAVVSAPVPSKTSVTRVYGYRDKRGDLLLTNVAIPSMKAEFTKDFVTKGWSDAPFSSKRWRLNRDAFNDLILSNAQAQGVDPALVRAVIHAESSFNPDAVSPAGARGLMQLMPATAARFGVSQIYDPEENIRGGVTYLRFLLDKFNGDMRLAAAGYNAGEGAVMKYGGVPPYDETTNYVARVMDLHGQYRAEQ